MTTMFPDPSVSVVMPVRNESGAIGDLPDEIEAVLRPNVDCEIVVDDGSIDGTAAVLSGRCAAGLPLRVLRHPHSAGQSAAVHAGVIAARSDVVSEVRQQITEIRHRRLATSMFFNELLHQRGPFWWGCVVTRICINFLAGW